MDRNSQRRQLIDVMRESRERYLEITNVYDGFLQDAHKCEHGTQALIAAIRNANAIGPKLTFALKKYHDAVKSLVRFYKQH